MWLEEEKSIIYANYGKIPIKDLRLLLPNKSATSISKYASDHKLKGNQSLSRRRFTFDKDYFSTPNLDNCYWAGFIAADGCLSKDGSVIITLQKTDLCILEAFKKAIQFSGDIKYVKTNKTIAVNRQDQYKISVFGAYKWHEDLNNIWNITPNKTYTLKPPNQIINNELAYSFLIGFFDGDGCWESYNKNGYQKYIFSLSGTHKMMLWCSKIIEEIIGKKEEYSYVYKKGNHYIYKLSNKKAYELREKLKLVNTSFKLPRKWEN